MVSTKRKNNKAPSKNQSAGKSRTMRIGTVAAIAIGIAVLALGAIYYLTNTGGPASDNALAGKYPIAVGSPGPGQEAPPIELPSTDGGTFDLASARGETVLLYFQEGLMCQPCWDQITDMEAQWGEFEELGIDRAVSITNDPLNALELKVESEGISTPLLSDPDLAVSKTYDANSYGMMGGTHNGHTFIVVGPEGEIKWRADYGGPPEYTMYVPVENLLADMRQGLRKGSSE
jgi:peroxiredoxin